MEVPAKVRRRREHGGASQSGRGPWIGTSGWHYPHWRGRFYPPDLPQSEWLHHYGTRLGCVELNNSFHHLPAPGAIAEWLEQVGPLFRFAVKANRAITHERRLRDCGPALAGFFEAVRPLGSALGPIVFQLPPRWPRDPAVLAEFLHLLPLEYRYVFELRDTSWHHRAVYDLLSEHGAAFCIYEIGGQRAPMEVTADLVYLRLQGPGAAYRGSYPAPALAAWARRIAAWRRAGHEVWAVFDNDEAGHAARNAVALAQRCALGAGREAAGQAGR